MARKAACLFKITGKIRESTFGDTPRETLAKTAFRGACPFISHGEADYGLTADTARIGGDTRET